MPCICGNKVDRLDPLKIICKLCKQFHYLKCYNMPEDLLKSGFKCTYCVSGRRQSLSSVPMTSATRKIGKSVQTSDMPVPSPVPGECEADVESSADAALSSDVAESMDAVGLTPTSDASSLPEIPLSTIYSELMALKTEIINLRHDNANLGNIVNLLRDDIKCLLDDKCNLVNKVIELEYTVRNTNCSCNKSTAGTVFCSKCNSIGSNDNKQESSKFVTVVTNTSAALNKTNSNNTNEKDNSLTWSSIVAANVNSHINKLHSPSIVDLSLSNECAKSSNNDNHLNSNINDINLSSNICATNVINKTKPKLKKIVIGTNLNNELSVFEKMKWFHISSFKNSVTTEDIIKYVSKCTDLSIDQFLCFKLVKKDADITKLKYVNFKLGTYVNNYKTVFNPNVWPSNIKIRPFNFLEKPIVSELAN